VERTKESSGSSRGSERRIKESRRKREVGRGRGEWDGGKYLNCIASRYQRIARQWW
jgi:hypothetical protein